MAKLMTPMKKEDAGAVGPVVQAVDEPVMQDPAVEEGSSVAARLGYQVIGPLCYGFARWVADQAREAGISNLYFLSRDGWLLKKAFDQLTPHERRGLTSHYLYSSRRAVWFASLREDTPDKEFNEILSGASPYVPVKDFLSRIFIDAEEHRAAIRAAGFEDENTIVKSASDKQKLYRLFAAIKPRIVAHAAQERKDYLDYLKRSGLFKNKRAGLVDVGWTGSIVKYTRALVKEADPDVDLHGYFIGVGEMAHKKYGFDKGTCLHGYLFDFDDGSHPEVLKNFFVVEKFLSPNEPSLIKMERDGDSFRPVYKHGAQEESPLNMVVQQTALQFVRDTSSRETPPSEFRIGQFLPALKKLLADPDPETAELLSRYSYSSDFGYQVGPKVIARSNDAATYLRSPLLLFKDYRRARWKAGFIAQQPLPARLVLRTVKRLRLDKRFDDFLLWRQKMR